MPTHAQFLDLSVHFLESSSFSCQSALFDLFCYSFDCHGTALLIIGFLACFGGKSSNFSYSTCQLDPYFLVYYAYICIILFNYCWHGSVISQILLVFNIFQRIFELLFFEELLGTGEELMNRYYSSDLNMLSVWFRMVQQVLIIGIFVQLFIIQQFNFQIYQCINQIFIKQSQNLFVSMQSWKRIDKYQINLKNLLGQGSYASVYLGKSTQNGDKVAVKVIQRRMFMDSYNLKNLNSEIQIMKKVNHENIVKLHDVYQTNNNMYIITQFCQEGDLNNYLQKRDKKLAQSQAKRLLKQIMKGAKYLHQNGIIHRDLKPANILIKNGVCKISDFGFAKNLGHSTVLRSIVGTPLYMSPQLLKGLKYTSKSDLWSIGLIYYEMLHGRTPWPAHNEIQLINAIYSRLPVFARQITEVSKNFIQKCLEIQQRDRMNWEQAFQHKLLKQFSRVPKDHSMKQTSTTNKQNLNHNDFKTNKQGEEITYIKNLPTPLRTDLSEKALRKLQNMTPCKVRVERTPSRSRTVAKFAGSRVTSATPRQNIKSPFIERR